MPDAPSRLPRACMVWQLFTTARALPEPAAPPLSLLPQLLPGGLPPHTWSPSQSLPFTVSYMCQRQSSTVRLASAALMPPCRDRNRGGVGIGEPRESSEGKGARVQAMMRDPAPKWPVREAELGKLRPPAEAGRPHTAADGCLAPQPQARITTGRESDGPPQRSHAHGLARSLAHSPGETPQSCVAAAHLGRHSVAARGEQLGNHCRLEAVLRQAHRRAQAGTTGTHNDRIVRVVDCNSSRQRGDNNAGETTGTIRSSVRRSLALSPVIRTDGVRLGARVHAHASGGLRSGHHLRRARRAMKGPGEGLQGRPKRESNARAHLIPRARRRHRSTETANTSARGCWLSIASNADSHGAREQEHDGNC